MTHIPFVATTPDNFIALLIYGMYVVGVFERFLININVITGIDPNTGVEWSLR